MQTIAGFEQARGLAVLADGRLIVAADGSVFCYNSAGVETEPPIEVARELVDVAAYRDGVLIALDTGDLIRRSLPGGPIGRIGHVPLPLDGYSLGQTTVCADPSMIAVVRFPPLPSIFSRSYGELVLLDTVAGTEQTLRPDIIAGVCTVGDDIVVSHTERPGRLIEGQDLEKLLAETTGRVSVLRDGQLVGIASDLPRPDRLGASADGETLFLTHPGAHAITAIHLPTGATSTTTVYDLPGVLIEAIGTPDGRVAILTSTALQIVDSLSELAFAPELRAPTEALFCGSWIPLDYSLRGSGLQTGDVSFEIPLGREYGHVSHAAFDETGETTAILIAGRRLGSATVNMVETATGEVLASADFTVTNDWHDWENGPSRVQYAPDADGVGTAGDSRSADFIPRVGEWRILVVLVDTASRRWPTTGAALTTTQNAVLDQLLNGVSAAPAGTALQTGSVRAYFEEATHYRAAAGQKTAHGLTMTVPNGAVFGPVSLSGDWTDYFKLDGGTWLSIPSLTTTVVTEGLNAGTFTKTDLDVDAIVAVVASPGTSLQVRSKTYTDVYVWPHAYPAGNTPVDLATGSRDMPVVFAPLDFATYNDRELFVTLSHELGHTLGLPDLYGRKGIAGSEISQDILRRVMHGVEMMAGSRATVPQFSLPTRVRMNWVDPATLLDVDFTGGAHADRTVTLHAAELANLPSGRVRGIRIAVGNGARYYVEYRVAQPGQISDLGLASCVVISDDVSIGFPVSSVRPQTILVAPDAEGDTGLLQSAHTWTELSIGRPGRLSIEVKSTTADSAVVRIISDGGGVPDVGVYDWDGGPKWQTVDIEVTNQYSDADPKKWKNVPVIGEPNKLRLTVHNFGDHDATGVVAHLSVAPFTTATGPWERRPDDAPKNIPAGRTAVFETDWTPEQGSHFCVLGEVDLYVDPVDSTIVDKRIHNQETRSNYMRFVSKSSSPSSRVGTTVDLSNPLEIRSTIIARVHHAHPQHRVLLSHTWRTVEPLSSEPIQVWDEALYGTPEWMLPGVHDAPVHGGFQTHAEDGRELLWTVPNQLSVEGWARPQQADECAYPLLTGGVGLEAWGARRTTVLMDTPYSRFTPGLVQHADGSGDVTAGTVLVEQVDVAGRRRSRSVEVDDHGAFSIEWVDEGLEAPITITAHYLGVDGSAPSVSPAYTSES